MTKKDMKAGICEMQHRHFASIAKIIREGGFGSHREIIAREFADRLRTSNPNFDRERFLNACAIMEGTL